jgi:UDP-N-acetylenolpyruvoylglucosamine reductase
MKKINVFLKSIKDERLLRHVRPGYLLSRLTTMGVGGPCDALVQVQNEDELGKIVSAAQHSGLAYKVIGSGSNIVFRDAGFRGIILSLKGEVFGTVQPHDGGLLCGASATPGRIIDYCISHGLGGLEFLSGIPGTLGGMIRTNAGAFSRDIGMCVQQVQVFIRPGHIKWLGRKDLSFSYRSIKGFPDKGIILRAVLGSEKRSSSLVRKEAGEFLEKRKKAQPRGRSSGSIFRNPAGRKAWEVIDKLGMRGYCSGNAGISSLHANWILNKGGATARDIRRIISLVQRKAMHYLKIKLQTEVEIL